MPVLTLPFAHLNLKFNPFGEATREDRAEMAVADVDRFVELLQRGGAVEFVGGHGRGKSTQLLALHRRFPEAHYLKLQRIEAPRPAGLLFVDEVELVRDRDRLFRRCRSIALGAHRSHADELRRRYREVETVIVAGLTVGHLRAIVDRRIEWARRGPGPVPRVPDRALAALIARFDDDVRSIESILYSSFQELDEVGNVEV